MFLDADDLHPAANVDKMAPGTPLNDDDRAPWLDIVGKEMRERPGEGRTVVDGVLGAEAAYRDAIRAEEPARSSCC